MAGLIDRLRRPEHTGENRCIPCTAVNVGIAVVAGVLAGIVLPVAGPVVLGVSLAVIYLRGYLVPGTPTLTRRYLPAWILARFGKDPGPRETPDWSAIERHENRREHSVDPATYLLEETVIEPDGEGYALAPAFQARLREETAAVAATDLWWNGETVGCDGRALAGLLEADAGDINAKQRSYPALRVGSRVRRWPSSMALAADLAAHRVLAGTAPDWQTVPLEQRLRILKALRSIRETCPCGGALAETTETVDSCCRSGQVYALTCEACEKPLLERDRDSTAWFSVADN